MKAGVGRCHLDAQGLEIREEVLGTERRRASIDIAGVEVGKTEKADQVATHPCKSFSDAFMYSVL